MVIRGGVRFTARERDARRRAAYAREQTLMSTQSAILWRHRAVMSAEINRPERIVGYGVEATDGHLGMVDEPSNDTGRQYVVVDTGFWIFGKKRLIPVGVIDRIDHADKQVHLRMTKAQVKEAPDYDEATTPADDADYDKYSRYYGAYCA
jgi:hypothetical protein